jgi:hypothetical protein
MYNMNDYWSNYFKALKLYILSILDNETCFSPVSTQITYLMRQPAQTGEVDPRNVCTQLTLAVNCLSIQVFRQPTCGAGGSRHDSNSLW